MSDHAQTDSTPIDDLSALVHHLAEELAGFRRRALVAEARVKEIEAHENGVPSVDLLAQCNRLEKENQRLQDKLETATVRTKMMLDRVRFLRQQAQDKVGGGER